MKSPSELKSRLRRQWESANARETRLLHAEDSWPVVLSIGKPKPRQMQEELDAVKRHVELWRRVKTGEVRWEPAKYRATSDAVELPVEWIFRRPTEWIAAAADPTVSEEFDFLSQVAANSDSCFHRLLIRRRSLWREKSVEEVCHAARLAMALEPGMADGQPLRTIPLEGIDTKFFERNSRLITALLDARFDGEVSKLGLEVFLGAFVVGSHWLLVLDLDGGLLPFPKQRVASSDLQRLNLPGKRLLIVENESSQHQLSQIPHTVAVLGAGFDLGWTKGASFESKSVAYWGDIDTWGLQFLGQARQNIPNLHALLMDAATFEANRDLAVCEPVVACEECPTGLSQDEQLLYLRLLEEPKGRLEQEFIPSKMVAKSLAGWAGGR